MKNFSTLAELSQGRDNNLNLVRLFAAVMVMYMHSFALCLGEQERDIMYTLTFHKALSGQVGVDIFFVISGFLIYRSWDKGRNVMKYARARFLRIWPLLAVFVLATAFIIGPAISAYSVEEYYSEGIADYLKNLYFHSAVTRLPGVFLNHIVKSVNGSLWTLRYEVICYILVVFMAPLFRKCREVVFAFAGISAIIYIYFSYGYGQESFWGLSTQVLINFGRLFLQFCVGVAYYLYQDRAKMDFRLFAAAFAGLVLVCFLFDFEIAFAIFGAYIIIYIGFHDSRLAKAYGRAGDLSYGVYILSFLVQQLVIDWFGKSPDGYQALRMNPYANLGISLLITLPLSYISWHLFEKQLLKLK